MKELKKTYSLLPFTSFYFLSFRPPLSLWTAFHQIVFGTVDPITSGLQTGVRIHPREREDILGCKRKISCGKLNWKKKTIS
jgi:hypothetical protein